VSTGFVAETKAETFGKFKFFQGLGRKERLTRKKRRQRFWYREFQTPGMRKSESIVTVHFRGHVEEIRTHRDFGNQEVERSRFGRGGFAELRILKSQKGAYR
jgi:hypothetical protein